MTALPILHWPDPRLSQVCAPADPAEVGGLISDMFETMYAAPGRGLAGPQVGAMLRVFVMDAGWKDGDKTPLACINPSILAASDELVPSAEGCLSMPGVTALTQRHAEITLAFTDLAGQPQQRALTGFEAICAQHELDHLDGIMHFDRMAPGDRAALLSRYEALS
ncbi:peptide deformylase [Tropicibacter naphthalenivorans]|uniref:Peptide deformylase n=1 Tax=Tropicibacter naphthalenivorans TaxID=441103 RepID=A0A0P1GA70_9RHOB|nr:peptide deformylase [Tropicibacter naphthalenivorans]CUH78342.1 Peptide deformylase [Tropicibacter naphthalenivorans]SMC79808.1 peptide deformylase [Tropicibacter naphthalenivorans]